MKRVIALYLVFLIVLSTLVFAQDSDASAAVKEDQIGSSVAAPGKCWFFCRMEKVLITGDKFKMS